MVDFFLLLCNILCKKKKTEIQKKAILNITLTVISEGPIKNYRWFMYKPILYKLTLIKIILDGMFQLIWICIGNQFGSFYFKSITSELFFVSPPLRRLRQQLCHYGQTVMQVTNFLIEVNYSGKVKDLTWALFREGCCYEKIIFLLV